MARRAKARRARCVICARVAAGIAASEAVDPQFRLTAVKIRPATDGDSDAIWNIFHEIVAAGDTYAFDSEISRDEGLSYWFRSDTHTYVAEKDNRVVGTYILKANQLGPGSHVANAGFMVASDAQGSGVGRAMAEHCLSEARRLGFRAMQFNFVVSTNDPAVHLWQDLGFKVVGTLPGAFRHPEKGYVDVYVMYRSLLP
jgi:L-amino acid N-acyltransferase YncA